MRITLAAAGPAPAGTAWDRYADPSLWHTWSPQISRVELDAPDRPPGAGRLRPGLRGTVVGRGGLRVVFVVERVDPPADPRGGGAAGSWAWSVRPTRAVLPLPGPLQRVGRMHLEHAVVPGPGAQGARTTLVLTGAAPVVLAYAPLARLALRRLVR